MFLFSKPSTMITADEALPGRDETMPVPAAHEVLGNPISPPFPEGLEQAIFGLGCFWGAERIFWGAPGVYTTAVGYAGGFTANPTYEEVCSGRTGHTEAVLVVFDPQETSYDELLRLFWENHDPTQGMRQGNDQGTQYRSAIYTVDEAQRAAADRVSWRSPASARSRPRSQKRGRSTTPSRTTSSTSRRTPTATADSAAPVSPAPSNSRPRNRFRLQPVLRSWQ
jgi:peptide-methionine (S)-S-oxide reductase